MKSGENDFNTGLANQARNAVKFNHIWNSVYQNKYLGGYVT